MGFDTLSSRHSGLRQHSTVVSTDTERQKTHAQSIASENNIMQQLGCTRGQAYATIHAFRKSQVEEAKAKAAVKQPDPIPEPEPVNLDIDVTKFDPRPLTLGLTDKPPQQNQQPGGGIGGSPLDNVIIVRDGVAIKYTMVIIGGGVPV